LGSGEGRVVIAAAKKWLNSEIRRFVGVEISNDLVNVSNAAAQKVGVAGLCLCLCLFMFEFVFVFISFLFLTHFLLLDKCEFEIGDIFTIDLSQVSLILIHHADSIVQKLKPLIAKRLRMVDKPCVVATITYPFQNWSHFHQDELYDIFLYDLTFDKN